MGLQPSAAATGYGLQPHLRNLCLEQMGSTQEAMHGKVGHTNSTHLSKIQCDLLQAFPRDNYTLVRVSSSITLGPIQPLKFGSDLSGTMDHALSIHSISGSPLLHSLLF